MLYRETLRDLVHTLLDGNTVASNRVYRARSEQFVEGNLPAIAIFTPSETGEAIASDGPPAFRMSVEILIRVQVEAATDDLASSSLDALCEQVEDLLLQDNAFLSAVSRVTGLATNVAVSPDGAMIPGAADITITATYDKCFDVPVADDLTKLHADWDIEPHGNVNPPLPATESDAEDDVTLPIT
jgi:hypothetical protein